MTQHAPTGTPPTTPTPLAGTAAATSSTSTPTGPDGTGAWLMHEDRPLSPIFDINVPLQIHTEIYQFTDRLRTPADGTPADAKTAGTAFLRVNSKAFDATEEAMGAYADLIPRSIKRMPPGEFSTRRTLARGMFTVVDGLVDVISRVRFNAVVRTDELAAQASFARDEAQQAATGPGGATNARAQAVFHLLDGPYQILIQKQQQGKTDALKQQQDFNLQAVDVGDALQAAYTKIQQLEDSVAAMQRDKLLGSTPAVTPPVPAPKGHKAAHPPAPPSPPTPPSGPATPPTANSRHLPRK